ncbi:hypothetical protein THASP1DRAFT_32413 [Thamnocephalis sphaerospora]|uniref:Probable 26S proteasome regulatory subunit p27 n=1 Tax=Thamnocephalis sphaerospora TaxID=78915 RepID=A0A4V1IVZ2_9FUNG|nr:hypothetical protein THASP1DRAFT_32413 [Thamnocephalis sphaerospora]|eukprot:RKP05749.1 hypothetical protein THASP1DRAFT_32413 [Thamnocephalis sphaerospora]
MTDHQQLQTDAATRMQQAQALLLKKDTLEAEIREQDALLASHGVAMNTPMVDAEGFPRADVDIPTVVQIRGRITQLRNDLKVCVKDIEEALHAAHAAARAVSEAATDTAASAPVSVEPEEPFVRVNAVEKNSPAEVAGLRPDDLIVRFGHVHAGNHCQLAALSELVRAKEGQSIALVVKRDSAADKNAELVRLTLRPRSGWGGRGLLGCYLVPV